jgi:hypothetical protein
MNKVGVEIHPFRFNNHEQNYLACGHTIVQQE